MTKQLTRLLTLLMLSVAFLGLNRTQGQVLMHYWYFGKGDAKASNGNYYGGPKFSAPWVINATVAGTSWVNTSSNTGVPLHGASATDTVKAHTDLGVYSSLWKHINADYSILDSTKAQISFAARFTAKNKNGYKNYDTYVDTVSAASAYGANLNLRTTPHGTPYPGEGLRVRNPSDSIEMLIWAPTTGYKNIKFSWEVSNSSPTSGVPAITYAYSVDSGKTWITTAFKTGTIARSGTEPQMSNQSWSYSSNDKTRDTILSNTTPQTSEWNVKSVDLSGDTSINNNRKFVIRIRTEHGSASLLGKNTTNKGNIRIDNIVVEGTPTTLFGSITKLQTTPACVSNTAAGNDSMQISFGPAVAYSGHKFFVQLSDSFGSFTHSANLDSFACSATGAQTLNFHIPAGYYSNTATYKVRVLCPATDTFSALQLTNISYSPQNVSSVAVANGFNTGTISWGTPGGCSFDSILVVVSPNSTKVTPTANYTGSAVYGSGSHVGSGYAVYYGNTAASSVTVTNVKNDSIYYATVYVKYRGTWTKGLQATLAPTPYVTVNYWNFNNSSLWSVASAVSPSTLSPIRANYSAIDTGITKLSFVTKAGTSASYATYYNAVSPGSSINTRFSAPAGTGLRLNNPSDSMMVVIATPSTGYKRLKISYDRQTSGTGPTALSLAYSTNGGTTWKTSGMSTSTDAVTTSWGTSPFITFSDTTVNNNPNLMFRIITTNNNTGTSGNLRLDNFVLDGVYEGNYNKNTTITKLQGGNICITKTITAKDSIYFTYSPKTSVPKGTTFTAQISDSFGSFAAPVNIGTVNSDTSGRQVIVGTIPASRRNARNNYIRIVSSVDTSSNKLLTNIVYSPAHISFVSATNGNTSSYVNWGVPGGCYYDNVLIIVSRHPISGTPSATTYSANLTYGLGASVLGGYAVYQGNHTNATAKVIGLKNDSTYYVAVYVLKGTEWSAGVSTTCTPAFSQLVHYWHFNNFSTGLSVGVKPIHFTPYRADYTLIDTATAHVAYQRVAGTSDHYATFWAPSSSVATNNNQVLPGVGAIPAGNMVHFGNPNDSMALIIWAPTQGYKNMKLAFEATNSSVPTGVPDLIYTYTTDSGSTWKAVPDTWITPRPVRKGVDSIIFFPGGTAMSLHSIDFSLDTNVSHNPKFGLQMLTTVYPGADGIHGSNGKGGSTSGGWYIDNVTVSGAPLSGSIGIASYQSSNICITNTASGLDTIGFYYNPAVYFNGIKFTIQLSEPNGQFVTPTTIATVKSDGTGSQKVVATIPAGTKNSTDYAIRVISSIGDGTPYGISNIVYSPGEVSSVTANGGNNSASVKWGAPTGCHTDSILVVVSNSSTMASPTVGGKADSVYGSGTAFGGGYVVFKGTGIPDSMTVTGLTNDTTYYAYVFTSYQNVWSTGVMASFIPRATSASMDASTPLTSCSPKTFTIPVDFTGLAPYILTYNNGVKDTTITTSNNPYNIIYNAKATTLFTLKSVYNYGGSVKGTIGTATRSVDILSNAARTVSPASSTICSGSAQQFTLSNYNAVTNVAWYYNTNPTGSSSSWTSFGGNYDTATLSNITSTIYVHAVVTASGCTTVASANAVITVDSASKLTAGAATSTTVALSWTKVLGATRYTIHYGSSTASASGTSYTLTGLTPCTTYSIYITPNASSCATGNSNTVSVTTLAAPLILQVDTVTGGIKAHWSGGKGYGYKLYVTTKTSQPNYNIYKTKDTTYTVKGLAGQSVYAYVVLDSGSTCSTKPTSATININVGGGGCTTAAPGSILASTTSISASLTWSGSASHYAIYYKPVGTNSWTAYTTTNASYTLTGLVANKCYVVFVANVCSTSPYTLGYTSALDTICTPKVCSSPTNLVLSKATCHGFTATWNAVTSVSNYSVYFTRTSGSGAPSTLSYRTTATTITTNSFSPGTSYSVYIKANCSTGGQSFLSNTETTTTLSVGCKEGNVGSVIGANNASFNVYPNPNTGKFVINMTTTSAAQTATVEVMNVLGQMVYSNVTANINGTINESVDLDSKATGFYIVRVVCGSDVQETKVQVTH